MHRPVMSLAVFATVAFAVLPVSANPLTGNERFSSRAFTQESTPTLAPAKRVEPVRQIESIQRSDSAALLIPTVPGDNLRPTVSNTVDSTSSLGKITTSSVSKLILNSETKPAAQAATKSGESNPLLEALRWKGATAPQVGVPSDLWCADFMNFILGQTGHSGTGSRAARSFLKYGKPLDGPRVGAIVVFTRGGNGQSGHVGIVRGTDGEGNPIVISGNHGNKVSESMYKKEKVLGYFMPPNSEKTNAATMNATLNQVIAAQR
jgi:uncharacterized protein (TIGR02594 family)